MHKNETHNRFLISGEVYADLQRDSFESPLRLGGIFHSARAFSAINCNYAIAAIAPRFLNKSIEEYGQLLNAQKAVIIGEIDGAPNVITIQDSPENGNQGYNEILRDQSKITINQQKLNQIIKKYKPINI